MLKINTLDLPIITSITQKTNGNSTTTILTKPHHVKPQQQTLANATARNKRRLAFTTSEETSNTTQTKT